jgi:O-acetyl-ADP-ribose deacetylase (regulator of RNase III)
MLYEVKGDILLSGAEAIAHGVAANDPMNQGLAQALHKNYPAMHKDFHHWCHEERREPGSAWIWSGADGAGGAGGVRIVNLLTQEGGYGHGTGSKPGKASIASVNHALRSLKKIIAAEKLASVALPRLATGVGGLSWDAVAPLIRNQLADVKADIYVYSEYVPGLRAVERGLHD